MTCLDEATRTELVREIALTLAKKQRLAFASDFHAFAEGRHLTLAGVTFDTFPKGPNTKRSDGDVVAHAIVMALAAAVNRETSTIGFPIRGKRTHDQSTISLKCAIVSSSQIISS